MKKLLLLFLFFALLISAKASHIVGGEFELKHQGGNTYRLTLILYFDSINGSPGARDPSAQVRFFRKRDNSPVFLVPGDNSSGSFTLPFDGNQLSVEYTNQECRIGELVTNKLIYTSLVVLRDDVFNDPEGYYVSWERCCRNYNILNIFSEQQPGPGKFAGQTFYLEFPPVVKDGEPFINNTPRLFPPLSDFGCPRIPYYVDFAGTDDDGDSLVYSLVAPLNTFTADALPPGGLPRPGPYNIVEWKPGFGLNNILNGVTNLEISEDGFLTVTPNSVGLYVFAVKCEEFRDKVKIGEVRRDFQMLVLDACPTPVPPKIVGKELDDAGFGTTGNLNVTFDNALTDAERCFEVKVSDPSSMLPDDFNKENVRIKAIPIGFKKNVSGILPSIKTATLTSGSDAVFQICLPKCPYVETGIFQIGIVAFDDACAQALTDTLVVSIDLQPPPNAPPIFSNNTNIVDLISEGGSIQTWPLQVSDADGNVLKYRLVSVGGFNLADFGMAFTGPFSGQETGPLNKTLSWDPKCDVYDFTQKTNFEFYFIVDDNDQCLFNHADTTKINLSITDFSQITPPILDYLLTPSLQENAEVATSDTLELYWKIYDPPIVIDVNGTDADNTNILLRGNGIGFNATSYGATFPRDFDQGSVATLFSWELDCSKINLDEKNEFEFQLIVVDSLNKCRFYKADTLHLIVHVEPPDNLDPELLVESVNPDQPIVGGSITSILGSPIELTLTGTDGDISPADFLKLELIEKTGNVNLTGFEFVPKEGSSPLQTSFTWSPDCSIFENKIYENNYTFKFTLTDGRCFNDKADTVTLNLIVKDVDGGDEEFLPPNAFSPNGDQWNEFYGLVKEIGPGEFESILPKDNCIGKFIGITFYNRWGKQVYESSNPDFKWYGEDLPTGIYYYYLLYSNKSYKGLVSIQY